VAAAPGVGLAGKSGAAGACSIRDIAEENLGPGRDEGIPFTVK
jgi:hypothetical protein